MKDSTITRIKYLKQRANALLDLIFAARKDVSDTAYDQLLVDFVTILNELIMLKARHSQLLGLVEGWNGGFKSNENPFSNEIFTLVEGSK
jgi:hypothetical protein